MKMIWYLTAFIIVLLLGIDNVQAQSYYYVRAGATGAKDGSDWDNAYTSPPSSLSRGATYYIADGSYPGYTFDDAVSGSAFIIIKKATASDHGTEDGWSSAYGDGQATFGKLTWKTNYYVFDGQTRDDNNWLDSTAYGFVVAGGAGGNNAKLFDVSYADSITVKYTYAYFNSVKTGGDVSANRDHGLYSLSSSNNIIMEYCHIKNTSYKAAILINGTSGPITIRYNQFENIYRKELFSARSTDNVTFAFNHTKNVAGTGAIVSDDSDNWGVYGNTFWSPDSLYSFTDVIMGTWTGDHPSRNETLNNWKIYNNTFYQMRNATQIQIQKGSGNEAKNNLFIGFISSINGSITSANNTQNASTSVIVNAATGNFHLNASTLPGISLPYPYNTDMAGNVRGAEGIWDRGAFDFGSGTGSGTVEISAPFNFRVISN